MVKGILVDYGGTLVRTKTDETILQDVLKALGYDFDIEVVFFPAPPRLKRREVRS